MFSLFLGGELRLNKRLLRNSLSDAALLSNRFCYYRFLCVSFFLNKLLLLIMLCVGITSLELVIASSSTSLSSISGKIAEVSFRLLIESFLKKVAELLVLYESSSCPKLISFAAALAA